MNEKKLAAQYTLTKIARELCSSISKIATTAGKVEKRELATPNYIPTYLKSLAVRFNKQIDSEIPIHDASGEPNDTYVADRGRAGKIQHISQKVIGTILNEGQNIGEKIIQLDCYIDIMSPNPAPFKILLVNGAIGSDSIPVRNIQKMVAERYNFPAEKIRIFVNNQVAVGQLNAEELKAGIQEAYQKDKENSLMDSYKGASSDSEINKSSARSYLERIAKK